MKAPQSFTKIHFLLAFCLLFSLGSHLQAQSSSLKIGVSEQDITPPTGFPMARYYHERLAEGEIDPLKAKAIVFRDGDKSAAIVVCDLIGVSADLAHEIRRLASEKTNIPYKNIVVSATHSHTAPHYYKSLYDYLGGDHSNTPRQNYIKKLINAPVLAIVTAHEKASPALLDAGWANQQTPVSFNRRFVMRNGSVKTWMNLKNPDTIKSAGPIDPQIGLLLVNDSNRKPQAIFSNFALHLDTVGGMKWSADYPHFIQSAVHKAFGNHVISIFGTGCCGDINHSNPDGSPRNKTDFIGNALGNSIVNAATKLQPVTDSRLSVQSTTVSLPLVECSQKDVEDAIALLKSMDSGSKVDFLQQVHAHKMLMVDQMRHNPPLAGSKYASPLIVSRKWAGIGSTIPTDVSAICFGNDLAIVTLPGEVFVDLGLAIKQASPFKTTLIVELSNAVETIYIPTRAAHAGGSYEVTNSTVKPGSGEMLVEAALKLLRQARSELDPSKN